MISRRPVMRHFHTRLVALERWRGRHDTERTPDEWRALVTAAREKLAQLLSGVSPRDLTPEQQRENMVWLKRELAARAGYRPAGLHMRRNGHAH
jgi:hypothetical protein